MRLLRMSAVLAVLLAAAPAARAGFVIQVVASLGPNVYDSPSYDTYRDSAIAALKAGLSQAGTPNTPGYYQAVTGPLAVKDLVVTDFPSWRGSASPTGAFAAETGTRLYFGLAVTATDGQTFSISQLSFSGVTSTGNALNFGFGAGEYDYSPDYVGVTASGQLVTSGPNTQQVVALYGRGSSNAFEILSSDPGATNQAKIDGITAGIGSFRFTGTYSLGDASGSAAVDVVNPVPAPPGWVGMAIGGVCLLVHRRRV